MKVKDKQSLKEIFVLDRNGHPGGDREKIHPRGSPGHGGQHYQGGGDFRNIPPGPP